MRILLHLALGAFLSLALAPLPATADEGPLDPAQPKGITPEEVIKRFADKETEFKQAREQYTYRQSVTV